LGETFIGGHFFFKILSIPSQKIFHVKVNVVLSPEKVRKKAKKNIRKERNNHNDKNLILCRRSRIKSLI